MGRAAAHEYGLSTRLVVGMSLFSVVVQPSIRQLCPTKRQDWQNNEPSWPADNDLYLIIVFCCLASGSWLGQVWLFCFQLLPS